MSEFDLERWREDWAEQRIRNRRKWRVKNLEPFWIALALAVAFTLGVLIGLGSQ